MAAQWYKAQEPFTIELDGVSRTVSLGEVLSAKDPVVKHDLAHGEKLFRALDLGEEELPPKPKARPAAKGGS